MFSQERIRVLDQFWESDQELFFGSFSSGRGLHVPVEVGKVQFGTLVVLPDRCQRAPCITLLR